MARVSPTVAPTLAGAPTGSTRGRNPASANPAATSRIPRCSVFAGSCATNTTSRRPGRRCFVMADLAFRRSLSLGAGGGETSMPALPIAARASSLPSFAPSCSQKARDPGDAWPQGHARRGLWPACTAWTPRC